MAMSIDGFVAGPNHGQRQSDGVSTERASARVRIDGTVFRAGAPVGSNRV
jgi:hypothetical protein